jgi:VIT1/CCC1 family predicted Fe2+/Mn2+ transporter
VRSEGESGPRHRRGRRGLRANIAASISLLCAAAGWVIVFAFRFAFRDAYWLFTFPLLGVVAVILGIVGLVKARRSGLGKRQATAGLIAGVVIMLLSGATLFLVWRLNQQWNF